MSFQRILCGGPPSHRPPSAAIVRTTLLGIALAFVFPACTGQLMNPAEPVAPGDSDGDGDGPGGSGGDPIAPAACEGVAIQPAPGVMRRLTNREFTNSVVDLLGVSPAKVAAADLPGDIVHHGFDNNAELQTLTLRHVERYATLAANLAADALAQDRRDALLGCAPTGAGRAACIKSFITGFGSRAFRRELSGTEVQELITLADTAAADADPYKSVQLVIEALLQSPSFLFRPELGDGAPQPGELIRLSAQELATRLSYAIVATTPSAELLEAAKAGALATAEGVAEAARTLLDDPRARVMIRDFTAQWFELSELPKAERSTEKYPVWSEALRTAMREQTQRFVDEVVWGEGTNFRDLFSSAKWPMNDVLGKFYGVPASSDWSTHEFDSASMRAGLLTQAAVLTVSSYSESAAPILRGRFVRENVLCETLPPPPPNVPAIPEPIPGESTRDRLARHRADAACSSCHALLDPVGQVFENFDIIGQFRAKDEQGRDIDATGSLSGFERADFDGPVELQAALLESERFPVCVAAKQYTYLEGRAPEADEACGIQRVAQTFVESGFDLKEALVAHLSSEMFRARMIKEAP